MTKLSEQELTIWQNDNEDETLMAGECTYGWRAYWVSVSQEYSGTSQFGRPRGPQYSSERRVFRDGDGNIVTRKTASDLINDVREMVADHDYLPPLWND